MVTAHLDCQKQNPRPEIRLQKFLALCGAGSRRACERLIDAGRVAVDGKTVVDQGVKIIPRLQCVQVDGRPVVPEPKITLLLNKPRDVICTSSDPAGRKTFLAYLPDLPARVFTIGRLDRASEGLLIITSDGELAQAVAHPRNMVEKTYLVTISAELPFDRRKRLLDGIYSEGDLLRVNAVAPAGCAQDRYVYRVKVCEGKNRHLRRMFAALGEEVLALKRIAIGPLQLGNLRVGEWRYMTPGEQDELQEYISGRALPALRELTLTFNTR